MKASAASATSDSGSDIVAPAVKLAPRKPAAKKAATTDAAVASGSAVNSAPDAIAEASPAVAVSSLELESDEASAIIVDADNGADDGTAAAEVEDEVADLEAADLAPVVEDDEDADDAPAGAQRTAPHSSGPSHRHGPGMMNGRPPQISRASNKDETFAEGDHVVYPTHGVGRVEKIATEEIAGHRLELIHITFEENRMTLRVPVAKARSAGLRQLATRKLFDEALAVLKGRARIKRTMWSRRAQEYEAKINSGDPLSIAEVIRDLHRNSGQPDQSFSERQIYEAALDRLAAELAALDQTDKNTAVTKLTNYVKTIV